MSYRPVRPTFDSPALIRREERALQIWGDSASGEVADAIYVSDKRIHAMVFTMAPGGGFTHSDEFRTFFDTDELYYILAGELLVTNPEIGEVRRVRQGEAVFFRRETWHHAFTHGTDEVRILEFIGPGPLSGVTQAYAHTKPNLTEVKTEAEQWFEQWPLARASEREAATLHHLTERDALWGLIGDERALVGIWASTDRMTVGSVHLDPSQRSGSHRHAGDECVVVLEGEVGIRLPQSDGQTWFELRPEDGMYIPEGTPHSYQNMSGRPATLMFIVGPSYRDPQAG
jgi:quercetin dioxygenase-like cupin family protein